MSAAVLQHPAVAPPDFFRSGLAQADPDADIDDLRTRYPKAVTGDVDGDPTRLTEMDALVSYLQMLGTSVEFNDLTPEDLQQ